MKKIYTAKIARTAKTSFDTFRLYLKKPASIIFFSAYAVVTLLILSTIGFSKLINLGTPDSSVPSLPETEGFAFLPADNLEVPTLGETDDKTPESSAEPTKDSATSEAPAETSTETTLAETSTPEPSAPSYNAPTTVYTPVIVEKEVIKEVPKEVVKEVTKEVIKEVPVETKQQQVETPKNPESKAPESQIEPEQISYDNYDAPELSFPDEEQNFPDVEETAEEATHPLRK